MIQRVQAGHGKSVADSGNPGGSLPSRVSSRSASGMASRTPCVAAPLSGQQLEVFVLGDENPSRSGLVLDVVRLRRSLPEAEGRAPGLIMSLNVSLGDDQVPELKRDRVHSLDRSQPKVGVRQIVHV